MTTQKTYIKEVDIGKLTDEINKEVSDIVSYVILDNINETTIYFSRALTAEEEAIIDLAVSSHTTYRSKVKIHNHIKDSSYNPYDVPKGHNYISGLQTKLFPVRTFNHGELTQALYYSDQAKTDLVIKVDVIYTRDASGFVSSRTTTRTWVCEDNTDHPDTKVTIKEYTQEQAIAEGVRRRTNVVDSFQQPTIGLMVYHAGFTPTDAVIEGSRFMESISAAINSYIHTPKLNHFQTALNNATETWLDADIGGGVTIRDFILGEITIG